MPHLSQQERTHPGETGTCCSVLELRQYTLRPGGRDVLVELFERSLVEPQRAAGMHLVGTFLDLDDADRFVWIRGFVSDDDRARALSDFYLGPVWAANKDAANATMLDSDDVLPLRPLVAPVARLGATEGFYSATVYSLHADADDAEFTAWLDEAALPVMERAGADVVALLRTNPAPNGFPRLPVREDERVVVVLTAFDDSDAHARYLDALMADEKWRSEIGPAIATSASIAQQLRLLPTALSELR